MNLLLDTHTFLWLVEGNSNLSSTAQTGLADSTNELFLSVASVWELAIKTANKKLTLSDPLPLFMTKWTAAYQLHHLPIQMAHALTIVDLPDHQGMTLVSGDGKFAPYSVPILW